MNHAQQIIGWFARGKLQELAGTWGEMDDLVLGVDDDGRRGEPLDQLEVQLRQRYSVSDGCNRSRKPDRTG
jgi:hypothetical protein